MHNSHLRFPLATRPLPFRILRLSRIYAIGARGLRESKRESAKRVCQWDWGRPERERRTPVNMRNRPHCDNGEEVAFEPLPYPLPRCTVETREIAIFGGGVDCHCSVNRGVWASTLTPLTGGQ